MICPGVASRDSSSLDCVTLADLSRLMTAFRNIVSGSQTIPSVVLVRVRPSMPSLHPTEAGLCRRAWI